MLICWPCLLVRIGVKMNRMPAGVIDIGSRPASEAAVRRSLSCWPYSSARVVPGNQPSPYFPAARIIRGPCAAIQISGHLPL